MGRLADAFGVLVGTKAPLPDAGGLINFSSIGGRTGGAVPKRGVHDVLQAYSDSPWLRTCASVVGESTAAVEWCLFREAGAPQIDPGTEAARRRRRRVIGIRSMRNPKKRHEALVKAVVEGLLEPVEQHPWLDIMEFGNEIHSGHTVRKAMQMHHDIAGESFVVMEVNGRGEPTQMFPIPPHWVKETPKPGSENQFIIRAEGAGAEERVPGEVVLWMSDLDPRNPYKRGSGLGLALSDELDIHEYASKAARQAYYNGARPDLIVTVEGITQSQLDIFRERWLERLQGFWNSAKPQFLNRKVEMQTVGDSMKDRQFIEVREYERNVIIQVWGVSPEVLGIVENSNRATIDAADFIFARRVLVPRLEKQRLLYQNRMIVLYRDPSLIVDYVSPVEEDREFKLKVMQAMPFAFQVDDIRLLAREEELEDDRGKVFVHQLGLTASEDPAGGVQEDGDDDPALPLPPPPDEEDPDDEGGPPPPPLAGRAGKGGSSARKAVEIGEAQIRQILAAIRRDTLRGAMDPVIREAVEEFGSELIDRLGFGINFDVDAPEVVEFLRERSASRISQINGTTQRRVRSVLASGVERGDSVEEMTRAIRRVFKQASDSRARMIATTETTRASNFGAVQGMKQGGVQYKQWLSVRDTEVRESHQPNTGLDGKTVKLDEDFISPVTGNQGPHPGEMSGGAGENANCRCTVLAIIDPDQTFAEDERRREKLWKSHEARRVPLAETMRRSLRRAFAEQARAVVSAMEELSS